jgi:adenylate kinase
MTYDTIFFIGPQGSGKGTQAKLLAKELGFFYWEMGAILRREAGTDSALGRKIADLINNGFLVDDPTLIEIIKDEYKSLHPTGGIIFDGVPRRIMQGQFLLEFLKQNGHANFLSILIDLPHEDSIKRLLERAHHEFRQDDTEDAILFRLKQYDTETLPVLDWLKANTTFVTIDGRPNPDDVTRAIKEAIQYAQDNPS